MQRHVWRPTFALATALGLVLGTALVSSQDAHAQGNGATVVRTSGDTCAIETSPGVFEEFTCDNLDVFTPNGRIRSHASGETVPPADGQAGGSQAFPTFPDCTYTVSASGQVRVTCHLN